jgi:hypothetical protein
MALLIGSLVLISNNNATENNDTALIVVSSYGGTDQNDLAKAVYLYDYLLSIGFGSDDIIFLCSDELSIKDDEPTLSNIEDAFNWLVNNSQQDSNTIIYIDDNAHVINSQEYYRFSDGNLNVSYIEDWIDEMEYSSLAYISTGDNSGLIGSSLTGEGRAIMSSMAYDEEAEIDRFNITRGLENIDADLNRDGWITFVEAFDWEEGYVEEYYDQDPQFWNS